MKGLTKEKEEQYNEDLQRARKYLNQAVSRRGEFSHNICSATLRSVAEKWGYDTANELVDEFNLTVIFGIPTVRDK